MKRKGMGPRVKPEDDESGEGVNPSPQVQLLEKIIALIINDNKSREFFYFDFPDRFHAQSLIFDYLDFFDAILCQSCGWPPSDYLVANRQAFDGLEVNQPSPSFATI